MKSSSSRQAQNTRSTSIDITQIIQTSQSSIHSAKNIEGKDAVVLVGNTGVGKTTTIHFMVGSALRLDKTTQSIVGKFPEIVKDFVIGQGVTSETKTFRSIDLSLPKPKLHIDYGLHAPLFLCDTPGLNDTGGNNASIANALTIVHPLRTARSVRVLVLFSFSDFNTKGIAVRETLESVAKLIPHTANHTQSILYCITGDLSGSNKDQVHILINNLIEKQKELKLSEDVKALLLDMQTKFKQSIPIINPVGWYNSIKPKELMTKILALTPIMAPKQELVPFVEKTSQEALALELNILFTEFQKEIASLKSKIADHSQQDFTKELNIIDDILVQLKFIHDYLETYDTQDYFTQCKNIIMDQAQLLTKAVSHIFNPDFNKQLNKNEIVQFGSIVGMQVNLMSSWMRNIDDHNIPTIFYKKGLFTIVEDYHANLYKKLEQLKQLQLIRFRFQLLEQLLCLINNITTNVNPQIEMLTITLAIDDKPIAKRISDTMLYLDIKDVSELSLEHEKTKKQLADLQTACGDIESAASIQHIIENLTLVEELITVDQPGLSNQFIPQQQIATLEEQFNIALILHDFKTAALMLDKIQDMGHSTNELDKLKIRYIKSFQDLTMTATINEPGPFSEAKLKQFIYAMQLLSSLIKNEMVEKHFKHFDAGNSSTGLNGIYNKVVADLQDIFERLIKEIDSVVSNETDIQGISKLNPLLQQLWYIQSIPIKKSVRNEFNQSYQTIKEKIRTFVIGFRQRFSERVKTDTLSNEFYSEVLEYIINLTSSLWVHQLQLLDESSLKLIEAIAERTKLLMQKLTTATETPYDRYTDILQYKPLADELNIILDTLATYISNVSPEKKIRKELKQVIGAFNKKLKEFRHTINRYSNEPETFQQLSIQQIVYFADYISQCEKLGIQQHKLSNTQDLFEIAMKGLLQNKMIQVETYLITLAEWQSAGGKSQQSERNITDLINSLTHLFDEIKALQEALPAYCNHTKEQYELLLSTNLLAFSEELSRGLIARLSNLDDHAAESRLGQMIQLCGQLQALDSYLPVNITLEIKKYASLYKKYDKSISNTYRELFSEILNFVRNGQYTDAIKKSDDKLATDANIKKVLCIQTSAIITQLARKVENNNKRLVKSISAAPDGLTNTLNDLHLLSKAKQLVTADLLSEDVLQDCNAILAASQVAIDQWFLNCVTKLNQLIDNFQFQHFDKTFGMLLSTTCSMSPKPTNLDGMLQAVSDTLDQQLQTIVSRFNQPTWIDQYNLTFIYQQLAPYDKTTWETVSASVIKTVSIENTKIREQIAANSYSVSKLIDLISQIEQQVIILPEEEINLKKAVLQSCYDSIISLINKMIAPEINFEDYLSKLCELMQVKDKLNIVLKIGDLEQTFIPIRKKLAELRAKIINSLQNDQFPATELSALITTYSRVYEFSSVVKLDFDMCKKAMAEFIKKVFRNLDDGLIAYYGLITHQQDADEAYFKILASCVLLTQINQNRKEVTTNGKIIFDNLLPENYSNKIDNYFQTFITIFKNNNNIFSQSLRNKNATELLSGLKLASAWENIIPEIARTISACADTTQQDPTYFMSVIKTYHPSSLIKFIEQELTEMIEKVTLNISTYLAQPEKGIAIREAYYFQLINTMEFISACEKLNSYIDVTPYKNRLLESTKNYLTQLYARACKELPQTLEPKQSWEAYNDCYKDLSLFAKHCAGYQQHLGAIEIIGEGKTLPSPEAANEIDISFNHMINNEILKKKSMMDKLNTSYDQELRTGMINLVISLQRIINTLPSKSEQVSKALNNFLVYLREKCGINYFQLLMIELESEESGLGLEVINQQACFRGMSIALRNTRTRAQDIEYVLKELTQKQGSGNIEPINDDTSNLLRGAYAEFQTVYDQLLVQYLKPEIRFDDNPTKHLDHLMRELKDFIQKNPIQTDNNKQIIWNGDMIKKIPIMMAYLFVLWTLRDAKYYFESSTSKDNIQYLKKPHPGQVIAIFRMLNIAGAGSGLLSHLVQTLSGEGKSIVVAITAALLALSGFSVNCASYSEYLSSRDFTDFEKMFEQLGISEFIKYGTFNTLCENILNKHGDLRELTEKLITSGAPAANLKQSEQRETIVIIDEVDVFFDRGFYGTLYNPTLRFNPKGSNEISELITIIWDKHKRGNSLKLQDIKGLPSYKACIKKWEMLAPLIDKAINTMIEALQQYKPDQGHQYTLINGVIGYAYQDGIATIHKGYKTMWAYCYEHDKGEIKDNVFTDSIGLFINCGYFDYSEILKKMGVFKCILGVTGTLRELSKPEQDIVIDEFAITQQTFIPSVYGPNRLRFAKKESVKIESDAHFYQELAKEIKMKQMGAINGETIRPVLVFFEDQTSLMNFYHSNELKDLGARVSVMTQNSSSSTAEQNTEINKAISAGQVTLIVKEKGRGRDFYCMSPKIEANGGVHVILTFLPDQVSLERQLLYRTARQGQDGSASMVLRETDLKSKYQLTDSDIQQMRDNNNVYELLDEARINNIATTYSKMKKEVGEARDLFHKPSSEYWQLLSSHSSDVKNIFVLLHGLNQVSSQKHAQHISRTLILMDATGSMSSLINGVKKTVTDVMNNMTFALKANSIAIDNLAVQLAIYRNYWDGPDKLFQYSPWSNNAEELNAFVKDIEATGGSIDDGFEAIEVGLSHALLEAEKKDSLTQVLLIGDMPPNTPENLQSSDISHAGGQKTKAEHQNKFYSGFEPSHVLTGKLAEKKVPVFTFFVEDWNIKTKNAFTQIATATKGTAEFLDVNSENASQNISRIIGQTVLTDVASGDEKLKEDLLKSYGEISHCGTVPGKR